MSARRGACLPGARVTFFRMRWIALAAAASLPAAAATVRGPADVVSLTSAADAVVHARVLGRESGWGAGGPASGLIFTRVTLQPIEWWKGRVAEAPVVVRVPGGSVGELTQTVDGVSSFAPDEEVVVFLRKLGDEPGGAVYAVERLALGKFSVIAGPAGSSRAVRDRSHVSCQGCSAAERDELSLSELRDRVRRSAGSAR
jgi:hypothetical protein